jgi:hypothetical protein
MRLRSIALLLLLALSLRLGAGPHPCHAMAQLSSAAAGQAACHQEPSPKAPAPEGEGGCCKGDHSLCENACQTAAVLQVALPAPEILPVQERASSPEHPATPPVAFPIDHIPLA